MGETLQFLKCWSDLFIILIYFSVYLLPKSKLIETQTNGCGQENQEKEWHLAQSLKENMSQQQ